MSSTCTALFYRGKHRGEQCTAPVFDTEKNLCERHSKCKVACSGLKPIQCTASLRSKEQCPNIGYYHNTLVCPRHSYRSKTRQTKLVLSGASEQLSEMESELVSSIDGLSLEEDELADPGVLSNETVLIWEETAGDQ